MNTIRLYDRFFLFQRSLAKFSSPRCQHYSLYNRLTNVNSTAATTKTHVILAKPWPVKFTQPIKTFSSRPRNKNFLFTWKSFFISTGFAFIFLGVFWYIKNEKFKQLEKKRKKSVGEASIGGSFELIDHNGQPFNSSKLLGKWALIYFGFTHCPDVCPDELEKIVKALELIEKDKDAEAINSYFITVDPERDDVAAVREYISEFSSKLIGLTGTREQIDKATKAYRVYYSAGPRDNQNDYIVDHTIITYLIDPEGKLVDYYGQTKTAEDVARGVVTTMKKYKNLNRRLGFL